MLPVFQEVICPWAGGAFWLNLAHKDKMWSKSCSAIIREVSSCNRWFLGLGSIFVLCVQTSFWFQMMWCYGITGGEGGGGLLCSAESWIFSGPIMFFVCEGSIWKTVCLEIWYMRCNLFFSKDIPLASQQMMSEAGTVFPVFIWRLVKILWFTRDLSRVRT